ncbi:MAG: hypothetical protein M3281_00870 [Chloroflexota bacterium]|nr:hypothetical protein [Chloroflexota bacterium]
MSRIAWRALVSLGIPFLVWLLPRLPWKLMWRLGFSLLSRAPWRRLLSAARRTAFRSLRKRVGLPLLGR